MSRATVHRETIFPFNHQALYNTLREAKETLPEGDSSDISLILEVELGQGVQCIWLYPEREEEIRRRLKTFAGCYGAWPIRRLNAAPQKGLAAAVGT